MSADQHNNTQDGFGLPGGFFERNAEMLRQRIVCIEELSGLPQLQVLKDKNPFEVPPGYFGVRALPSIYTSLPFGGQEEIFAVPHAYFETSAAELRTTMGLPRRSAGSAGFEVPRGYFTKGASHIKEAATDGTDRVRQLFPRSLRFAVAALLMVALGLWIFKFTTAREHPDCTTIACLEKNDLLDSRALESLSEDDLMLLIDGETLGEGLFEDGDLDSTAPAATKKRGDA